MPAAEDGTPKTVAEQKSAEQKSAGSGLSNFADSVLAESPAGGGSSPEQLTPAAHEPPSIEISSPLYSVALDDSEAAGKLQRELVAQRQHTKAIEEV